MTCDPRNIIRQSKGTEYVVNPNGDTKDIIAAILAADAKSGAYVIPAGLDCLLGFNEMDTLKNVWAFVKRNVRYRTDAPGFEKVKSPGALFHQVGAGDCKSFSIALVSILRAMGFKGIRYRFTGYKKGGDYTHVYVVVRHNGQDVILDSTHTSFNAEVPYKMKRDIPANTSSRVSGPPAVRGDIGDLKKIGTAAVLLFGLYYLLK